MAKKPNLKMPSRDLRKWCIEQAIKWPVNYYNGNAMGLAAGYAQTVAYTGGSGSGYIDQDVIGRAEKLLAWVSK